LAETTMGESFVGVSLDKKRREMREENSTTKIEQDGKKRRKRLSQNKNKKNEMKMPAREKRKEKVKSEIGWDEEEAKVQS